MAVRNPFDFFLEPEAEKYPVRRTTPACARTSSRTSTSSRRAAAREAGSSELRAQPAARTIDFLVELNQRLQQDIAYTIRMEPGVQTPEQTLDAALGSCRDTGWLLVQMLRHLGSRRGSCRAI